MTTTSLTNHARVPMEAAVGNVPPGSIGEVRPFRISTPNAPRRAARLRGKLPSWLAGELVKTGPAVFRTATWRAEHWFDGLGVVFAWELRDGRVHYRSRLLGSDAHRAASVGPDTFTSFNTSTKKSLWRRLVDPIPRPSDNANVNLVALGSERVAMTESPHQLVIDPMTLETVGRVRYEDDLPKRALMSAHPVFDGARGTVVNALMNFSVSSSVSFYEHVPSSRERRVFARFSGRRVPYVHSFGLTPRNAILIGHPCDVSAHRFLFSNEGFIDAFDWRPREGTRLVTFDRHTGARREFLAEPMFVFHTAQAFERPGETVIDVVAYDSPAVIGAARASSILERRPTLGGKLVRLRLRHDKEHAIAEPLADRPVEFPVVNGAVFGGAASFVWALTIGGDRDNALVKVDTSKGITSVFEEPDMLYGEPVFVADPTGTSEDSGVLLSIGSSLAADRATLTVLDARTLEVVAQAEIDEAVPLALHGTFFPDPTTTG